MRGEGRRATARRLSDVFCSFLPRRGEGFWVLGRGFWGSYIEPMDLEGRNDANVKEGALARGRLALPYMHAYKKHIPPSMVCAVIAHQSDSDLLIGEGERKHPFTPPA
jgi:hypothetical protein